LNIGDFYIKRLIDLERQNRLLSEVFHFQDVVAIYGKTPRTQFLFGFAIKNPMMSAFSENSISKLLTIFEEEGYKSRDYWDDLFRVDYLSRPDTMLFFGTKIPIRLPLRHQPPIEIVSFQLSFGIRPRQTNENAENLCRYLATSFKEAVIKLPPYTHDFNLGPYEGNLSEYIKRYYPDESVTDPELLQSDRKIALFVRDRILHSPNFPETYTPRLSQDILDCFHYFHLSPTDTAPPELTEGFPTGRENAVIFFRNTDFKDYLVEEPGSVTYWRDYHYKNVWIRTAMQTFSPYMLYHAFDSQEYRMNYLIYDWLVYCRGLIRHLTTILDEPQFQSQDLAPFSEVPLLRDHLSKTSLNALFMSPLVTELQLTGKKSQPDSILFESAPQSLEELSAIQDFAQARALIQRGKLSPAQHLLTNAKRKLKKYHHTHGLVNVILKLAETYAEEQKYPDAFSALSECIDLAKSGKIPVDTIIKVHNMLTHIHSLAGNQARAQDQFEIALKFLRSLPSDSKNDALIARTYLEMIKTKLSLKQYKETDPDFREMHKLIPNQPLYAFLFYYERSHYYAGLSNEIKQMEMLEKALSISEGPLREYINAQIELGQLYTYNKSDYNKAIKVLKDAEKSNNFADLDGIKAKIKTFEILADAYKGAKNADAAVNAQEEAERLRERMDHI
jgi:tetratricopeptide (TPR) repeat protein